MYLLIYVSMYVFICLFLPVLSRTVATVMNEMIDYVQQDYRAWVKVEGEKRRQQRLEARRVNEEKSLTIKVKNAIESIITKLEADFEPEVHKMRQREKAMERKRMKESKKAGKHGGLGMSYADDEYLEALGMKDEDISYCICGLPALADCICCDKCDRMLFLFLSFYLYQINTNNQLAGYVLPLPQ